MMASNKNFRPDPPSEITISIKDLIQSRDAMLTGLTALTTGINDLLKSYINHMNTIMQDAGVPAHSLNPNMLLGVSMETLFNQGTFNNLNAQGPNHTQEVLKGKGKRGLMLVPAAKVKKERKLRDPNAPKRPLTAYFLYTTHARPVVKADLGGENSNNKEVSDEVLRRWNEMAPSEKQLWKDIYDRNVLQYRKDVADYKAGLEVSGAATSNLDAEGSDDDTALAYLAPVSDEDEEDEDDDNGPIVSYPPPSHAFKSAPISSAKPMKKPAAKKHNKSPSPSSQLQVDPALTIPKATPVPLPGFGAPQYVTPQHTTMVSSSNSGTAEKRKFPGPAGPSSDDAIKKAKRTRKDKVEKDSPEKEKDKRKDKKDKKVKGAKPGGL